MIIYYLFNQFYIFSLKSWKLTKQDKTVLFIYLLFTYTAALYLVLGSFENNRLRFEIIGLEVVLVVLVIYNLLFKYNASKV